MNRYQYDQMTALEHAITTLSREVRKNIEMGRTGDYVKDYAIALFRGATLKLGAAQTAAFANWLADENKENLR